MSEKGDKALSEWADRTLGSEFLGTLHVTKENIDGLQDLLLVLDQEGVMPLDGDISAFLQHALTMLEAGEPVVFMASDPPKQG